MGGSKNAAGHPVQGAGELGSPARQPANVWKVFENA
jgi:hypothetical protein